MRPADCTKQPASYKYLKKFVRLLSIFGVGDDYRVNGAARARLPVARKWPWNKAMLRVHSQEETHAEEESWGERD